MVALLAFALASSPGCDCNANINDEDRKAILDELRHAVDTFESVVEGLEQTFDEQRSKLTVDMQQTVATTILNMRGIVEQLRRSIEAMNVPLTNLKEDFTTGLTASLQTMGTLAEQLQHGVHTVTADTINKAANEIARQSAATLGQANQLVQTAIRPTLTQLREEADFLVGKVTIAAHVIAIRLIFGGIALVALIGLILAQLKLHAPVVRWSTVGITALVFLGGVLTSAAFAQPLALVGQKEVRIPKGEVVCSSMSAKGRELEELLGNRAPQLSNRDQPVHEAPMSPALLGSLRRAQPVHAGESKGVATSTPEDLATLATEVRSLASECQLRAPSLEWADLARVYFVRASVYLGEAIRCYTHADCSGMNRPCDAADADCRPQQYRCDTNTGECLPLGVYCEGHMHCEPGTQCNLVARRCVPTGGPCTTPIDCRPEESCDEHLGHCVPSSTEGPCEVSTAGVFGPCRQGTLQSVNRWMQCKPAEAKLEVCDGVDNDCNGTPDNGVHRIETCLAGDVKGECANGTWGCHGAMGWVCEAASPGDEDCDGLDDDCDGTPDNGVISPGACSIADAKGECAAQARYECRGTWQCVAGKPQIEQCDGLDNDCDDTPDNNLTRPPGACSAGAHGECARGNWRCDGTKGWACEAAAPRHEKCDDGLDNDCDGHTDEGCDDDDDDTCGPGQKCCGEVGPHGRCTRCVPVNRDCGEPP